MIATLSIKSVTGRQQRLTILERFRFPRWRGFWTRDIISWCVVWRQAFRTNFSRWVQTWKTGFRCLLLTCEYFFAFHACILLFKWYLSHVWARNKKDNQLAFWSKWIEWMEDEKWGSRGVKFLLVLLTILLSSFTYPSLTVTCIDSVGYCGIFQRFTVQ